MQTQLTFLNLRENLKLLLEMQGLPYIHDSKKELNAINKFTMDGNTPDYVIELIGKLIKIKRHDKLGKEMFWKGCAINLSDVYAYRVKIETVYYGMSFPNPPNTQVGVENFQPNTTNKPNSIPTWDDFLLFSKKLTLSSQAEIVKMSAVMDDKLILITGDPEDSLMSLITNYWKNAGLGVVFKKPTQADLGENQ